MHDGPLPNGVQTPSNRRGLRWLVLACALVLWPCLVSAASASAAGSGAFPPSLESYDDAHLPGLWDVLKHRAARHPFNLWATAFFLGAIVHTFLTHRFRHLAHVLEHRNAERVKAAAAAGEPGPFNQVSAGGRFFHFLGEIEAVFGIWIVPLLVTMYFMVGREAAVAYINHRVNYSEAVFVVVIMAIASTRPILALAENSLRVLARLGGERPVAWWLAILTVGPLLGSLITEPAAMTICASLLGRKVYAHGPGSRLAYGTLGLLFVAISIGGTLTHFAAPPVLMVAAAWDWDTPFMLVHFGWKAVIGILLGVGSYFLIFRRELLALGGGRADTTADARPTASIPLWVTVGHLLFLVFAVWHSHNTPFLLLELMFFLAFVEVTEDFQTQFTLRPPLLVGFFLAGLVIHGGLQQWWIAPVLSRLGELPLMLGAIVLTAFNDNAAITYLCTLVPSFTEGMKYAAVAGAVTGGGLTVIANAPNPAGQSILGKHFKDGISALGLLGGALLPTILAALCFWLFRS